MHCCGLDKLSWKVSVLSNFCLHRHRENVTLAAEQGHCKGERPGPAAIIRQLIEASEAYCWSRAFSLAMALFCFRDDIALFMVDTKVLHQCFIALTKVSSNVVLTMNQKMANLNFDI